MRAVWVTDPHLDHLRHRPTVLKAFVEMLRADSDCLIISGDISTHSEVDLFVTFAKAYGKPIYFVLGNHDYWGGSFDETHKQMRRLCRENPNMIWLDHSGPVEIAPGVEVTGVDGWYDAQFGSWRDSSFHMVDWHSTRDFMGKDLVDIVATCRGIARGFSVAARIKLEAAKARRVFFVTHVPPYQQSAMHQGRPSERTALPWYTSKILGEALSDWAEANPERNLITLCGHVHSPSEFEEQPNHIVHCGIAAYGTPQIAGTFDL